jgi:DNA-binding response OmpR family regulator
MDDYLAKPLRPELLAATLERWVRSTETVTEQETAPVTDPPPSCGDLDIAGASPREHPRSVSSVVAQSGRDVGLSSSAR